MINSFKRFGAYAVSKVETLNVKGGGRAIGSLPFSSDVFCITCGSVALTCKSCKEIRCGDDPRSWMNCG